MQRAGNFFVGVKKRPWHRDALCKLDVSGILVERRDEHLCSSKCMLTVSTEALPPPGSHKAYPRW